jgi:PAS domain S-box-containing protein
MAILRGIILEPAKSGSGGGMAKGTSEKITHSMTRVLRNPHLWILALILALLVVVHYHEYFRDVWILERIGSVFGLGLTRQTFGRVLFLIPIVYGTLALGTGAGLSILVLITAAMLPRVFLISPEQKEALFETVGIIFVGALLVALLEALQKGRQRLSELENIQNSLSLQVKRLGMLHVISGIVSRSLELNQVLAAVDKVGQLMGMEAAWLYLWDKQKKELILAASSGLTRVVVPATLKLGEGLEGLVAQSRQPIIVEDASSSATCRSILLVERNMRSSLVVPLLPRGEMMGTLGVGARSAHHFSADEMDLLRAIADQISMAVENAHLYERERSVVEALRSSERNYRELFENASDAIWVHDLNGVILASNSAFERLTGYERDVLIGSHVSMFFLKLPGLGRVNEEAHEKVLRGEEVKPYEQEMVRKDGSVVTVQLGTSLITKDGQPTAFQHIARDITEAKRAQDNLRFYVQQVSQAQEAERKRIARELHDGMAQSLVAVSRNLDDLASGNSQFSIKDIREQVRSILQEVRHVSQQLRPSVLDDLGLLPAVKWLASDLTKNFGIVADVEVVGKARQLAPEAELMLFRIVQEALTNVRRHSGANKVHIKVEFADNSIRLSVGDNGRGFEMPARVGDLARIGKLGLTGIQERVQLLGGSLAINSEPGKGTTLSVEITL